MDQLQKYQFEKIFPGCRLLDIHEYLMEKGVALDDVPGVKYLYHDPCHSPMKQHNPLQVANKLMGSAVTLTERCCGEAGTLAVSRPDISTQIRFRKLEELNQGLGKIQAVTPSAQVKTLTSCPSCLQGLARYRDDTGVDADYIVVELARRLLGESWMQDYIAQASQGGIEKVLL
jgi:Fe-S oxidoreductase